MDSQVLITHSQTQLAVEEKNGKKMRLNCVEEIVYDLLPENKMKAVSQSSLRIRLVVLGN
jgi:hypothetical protein